MDMRFSGVSRLLATIRSGFTRLAGSLLLAVAVLLLTSAHVQVQVPPQPDGMPVVAQAVCAVAGEISGHSGGQSGHGDNKAISDVEEQESLLTLVRQNLASTSNDLFDHWVAAPQFQQSPPLPPPRRRG